MAAELKKLEHPDNFHVSAAQGWLDLGNWREAAAELENISTPMRAHPAVLEVKWNVHAAAKNWQDAVDVACVLAERLPDMPHGWVHWAYALRRLEGIPQARQILLSVADKFPREYIIPYNLSCYACQLGELDAARQWLEKAIELAGRQEIRTMALADSDLQPLWKEISQNLGRGAGSPKFSDQSEGSI